METNLKPCPFCGGEVEAYDYEYGIDPAVAYGCKCERCGIAMSGYDSKGEAIEAWNTRHERTCDGCYHLDSEEDYFNKPCDHCIRHTVDFYEPKEDAHA